MATLEELERTSDENRNATRRNSIRDFGRYVEFVSDKTMYYMLGSCELIDDFCYILVDKDLDLSFHPCIEHYDVVEPIQPKGIVWPLAAFMNRWKDDSELQKEVYENIKTGILEFIKKTGRRFLSNMETSKESYSEEDYKRITENTTRDYINTPESKPLYLGI